MHCNHIDRHVNNKLPPCSPCYTGRFLALSKETLLNFSTFFADFDFSWRCGGSCFLEFDFVWNSFVINRNFWKYLHTLRQICRSSYIYRKNVLFPIYGGHIDDPRESSRSEEFLFWVLGSGGWYITKKNPIYEPGMSTSVCVAKSTKLDGIKNKPPVWKPNLRSNFQSKF